MGLIPHTHQIVVEQLGAGSSLSDHPVFYVPFTDTNGLWLNSIGVLTQGSSSGIDSTHKATISVKLPNPPDEPVLIASKEFSTNVSLGDFFDFGALELNDIPSDFYFTVNISQVNPAQLPAFLLVFDYSPK